MRTKRRAEERKFLQAFFFVCFLNDAKSPHNPTKLHTSFPVLKIIRPITHNNETLFFFFFFFARGVQKLLSLLLLIGVHIFYHRFCE